MEQQITPTQEDVDVRFSFRTGWPRLPVLPLQTAFTDAAWSHEQDAHHAVVPDFEKTQQEVEDTLNENGVIILGVTLCYRFNEGIPT